MFAVSRGRGGLDVKLDDIADRPGAALVTRSEPAISASIRLLPRRPASYVISGRRSADSRTPAATRCAACSFPRPGSAPWRSRSAASAGTDAQLRPHRRLALLGRLFGDALAQQPAPPRLHRHTPLDTAVPVLGTLLHSLVFFSAMQQRSRLRHVALRWPPSSSSCAPDPTRRPPRCAPSSRNTTACASQGRARRCGHEQPRLEHFRIERLSQGTASEMLTSNFSLTAAGL